MTERWQKPLKVIAVEEHPAQGIYLPDGRMQAGARITFDRESTERIRSGYACAKCLQVFEVPWPEHCYVCGAPIRSRQAEYFAKEWELEQVEPRPSVEEEIAGIHERVEEEGA